MIINFNCKVEELMKQLPKGMYYDVLAIILLTVQKQSEPFTNFLPVISLVKMYKAKISALLNADCKDVFSEETMKKLEKEIADNGTN